MLKISPNSKCRDYFTSSLSPIHKRYLALRDFFAEGMTAEQVALKHGYTVSTVYTLTRDFKAALHNQSEDPFFKTVKPGRKPLDPEGEITEAVVRLRKKYYSVPDIQVALDAQGINLTIYAIEKILTDAGFDRLPRRDRQERLNAASSGAQKLVAPISVRMKMETEKFSTKAAGLLAVIPTLIHFGIDEAIRQSQYPQTKEINRMSAILSFLALKLSNVKRYSADDAWCMDRGMGLFAGLNVLPKAAWFSSYSSGITRDMNVAFLKSLTRIWKNHDFMGDTANLDFTAIPYWGDDGHLENNWSGKRGKALASIQAALAQDPDTGIICYGDTTVRQKNQDETVLTFLDFYHGDAGTNGPLKYLVFDSKFTTYQNLCKIDKRGIKFITIRRRSQSLTKHIESIESAKWKKVEVEKARGTRSVLAYEDCDQLKGYDGIVRQVYIKNPNNRHPAILITNDFELTMNQLIRKYSCRWLVETEIAEQIDFFHLNRNSSGIVIKVDFDLTMTILAHNLLRLFCKDIDGFAHCNSETLYDKFISAAGEVAIENAMVDDVAVSVTLKKKRTLPHLLEHLQSSQHLPVPWLQNAALSFTAGSTT
jgi:transposase